MLAEVFRCGDAWLGWLGSSAARSLALRDDQAVVLRERLRGLPLRDIAARLQRPHPVIERVSLAISHAASARGMPTVVAAALAAVDAEPRIPATVLIAEVDARRAGRWRDAVAAVGRAAVLVDHGSAEIAIASPFHSDFETLRASARRLLLSTSDPCAAHVVAQVPDAELADPRDDLQTLVGTVARLVCRVHAARESQLAWPLPSTWLRRAFVDALCDCGSVTSSGRSLIECWIDCGTQKAIAHRLGVGVRAVESRATEVCRALRSPSLFRLPSAIAHMLDRRAHGGPHSVSCARAVSSRAESSRAEPIMDGRLPSHAGSA
ncbi:MAG: hypothetical protein K1X88_18780 [Nannocystaceae bacterium]|nr:hypothetical protein [Nannocystaceae bacterium]